MMVAAASIVWAVAALVVSYQRSLWADEWNHVQDILGLGVWGAAAELLKKPSPFTPGEAVFNGLMWKLLTPLGMPMEIWARVQGVFWGAASVAIAVQLYREQPKRFSLLPWFVAFSAALISYATEMRPYASLVFSGALITYLFWSRNLDRLWMKLSLLLLLLCGHIYGICFVGFALVAEPELRKRYWPLTVAGAAVVLFTLSQVSIKAGQGSSGMPELGDVIRQTLGTIGNPHKASYFLIPLALIGCVALWRDGFKRELGLILGMSVIMTGGPLFATIVKKYFFVPRQLAAASVPYLLLASVGADAVARKFSGKTHAARLAFLGICGALYIYCGSLSTFAKVPPFPSQPFHRFRELGQDLRLRGAKNILMLDVCNLGPFEDYLSQALNEKLASKTEQQVQGIRVYRTCWPSEICITELADYRYCTAPETTFAKGTPLGALIESAKFDAVVHGFPNDPPGYESVKFLRDW